MNLVLSKAAGLKSQCETRRKCSARLLRCTAEGASPVTQEDGENKEGTIQLFGRVFDLRKATFKQKCE